MNDTPKTHAEAMQRLNATWDELATLRPNIYTPKLIAANRAAAAVTGLNHLRRFVLSAEGLLYRIKAKLK